MGANALPSKNVSLLGLTHFDETSLFQGRIFNDKSRFFASIA